MAAKVDPGGREIELLQAYAGDLTGLSVLEIGCGDGRVTQEYATQAAYVMGVDPNEERIATAQAETPAELQDRFHFQVADITDFQTDDRFHLAVFTWSL